MKTSQTTIDHITITAPTLEAGAELVEQALGVPLQKGGEHPRMGTHNLFLRLGDDVFLEVIACNPDAKKPDRPRWFALDDINEDTPASLKTWVVRTDDIKVTLNDCSEPIGEIEPMSRGETDWLITIPKDGSLPVNEGAPALIQWQTESHPATAFIDHGLSLLKLQIIHPEPKRLLAFMKSINLKYFDENVEVLQGDTVKMRAYIDTPQGLKELSV
ncbi:MAG: VOC family protein [Cocleimonas sp.]|nr:VOC family protein [Cocleimonas sp.]